jgi:hypothetical protein
MRTLPGQRQRWQTVTGRLQMPLPVLIPVRPSPFAAKPR